MCELNFLPLRPGALEQEDMAEFLEEGIINADGKARCHSGVFAAVLYFIVSLGKYEALMWKTPCPLLTPVWKPFFVR